MVIIKIVTKHPETGEYLDAIWIKNYFKDNKFGVKFEDGKVFRESEIDSIDTNGVGAEVNNKEMVIKHWDKSNEYRTT